MSGTYASAEAMTKRPGREPPGAACISTRVAMQLRRCGFSHGAKGVHGMIHAVAPLRE